MTKQKPQPSHAKRPCKFRRPRGECGEATIDNDDEWQFCEDNEVCVLERRKQKSMQSHGEEEN